MKTTWVIGGGPLMLGLVCLGVQTSGALAGERLDEEFHQTYALATNGQVQVDNVNGKIQISAWDRPEVKVDAVKHAESQADLNALKIEIDSKPDRLRIHTKQPNSHSSGWKFWRWKNQSPTVDYEIKVPALAHLKDVSSVNGAVEVAGVTGDVHVSTVNGRLELTGVRGKTRASTVNGHLTATGLAADGHFDSVNGAIEATFDSLEGVQEVSAKTVNGRVELNLPVNADAEVSANTLNGGIQTDADLTVKKNWPVGKELHGKLGQGTTKVQVETVNGAIRIHHAAKS